MQIPESSYAQSRGTQRQSNQRGFTLLEIMVAFAIFALATGAWMKVLGSSSRTQSTIEIRQMALWSARNQLNLIMLGEEQASAGDLRQGPYQFQWQLERQSTDTPGIDRLQLQVLNADTEALEASQLAVLNAYQYVR